DVMSFNIRYDNPEDGKQNWHHRKENVVRMIHFYDLDIIGLQEVLVNQQNYLKESLSEYKSVGIGREDGKEKGEFASIFYKKDRFKILKSGTFWLSETPDKISKGWDADLERIATWAVFKDKNTREEFIFMNTHFDHIGNIARVESAKLLKEKAIELAGNLPLILTGDFNLVPESEGIRTLIKPDGKNTLINASSAATFTYGPDWTTCGFDNRPFEERKVIDYIFLKGISKVTKYAVFSEMLENVFLSDHCPVFAQIEL
ncbi:MAG: endonuclease/exonuclease/phosphatase family metal-dependent hydrolase, partial [Maribacter sp.]